MKKLNFLGRISLMLFAVCCFHVADAGVNHGGGGSVIEREFKIIGSDIIDRFDAAGIECNSCDIQEMRRLIDDVKIDSTFELLYRDFKGVKKRVDALNFPKQKRVLVSIPAWRNLRSREDKENLVFHELVSLQDFEKDSFEQSAAQLNILRDFEKRAERVAKRKAKKNLIDPEAQCSKKLLGTHEGGSCLWALNDKITAKIEKARNRLATVAAARSGDSEELAALKSRYREVDANLQKGIEGVTDVMCPAEALAFDVYAAYERDLCETNYYLKQLRLIEDMTGVLETQ